MLTSMEQAPDSRSAPARVRPRQNRGKAAALVQGALLAALKYRNCVTCLLVLTVGRLVARANVNVHIYIYICREICISYIQREREISHNA